VCGVVFIPFFLQVPTVIVRSPYGILGTQNIADLYLPFGFAAVEVNERGTGKSDGSFCFWMESRYDGTDTIAWITSQSFSNGQVFQMGASADGILSLMDLKLPQPAMGGMWLFITTADPYSTLMQNQMAFRQALSKDWLALMQVWRPKIPANTYYEAALRNEGFNASYTPPDVDCGKANFSWYTIDLFREDFARVDFPAVHLGGWYDIFLQPQLSTFRNFQSNSSVGGLGQQQLIIDPRGHCFFETTVDFPDDRFGILWAYERSVDIFKSQVHPATRATMPPSPRELVPAALAAPVEKLVLYVMGPSGDHLAAGAQVTGMYWTAMDSWPHTVPLLLFLAPGKQLSPEVPSRAKLSYLYNPSDPTPTIGGNNLFLRCGPQNQITNDQRADNIVFDYVFDQDTAILGSVQVNLRVATSANDTDFVVRISDVYPGGKTSMLLSDNVVRMRWRDSAVTRSTTQPGVEYVVSLGMWELCYVFNAGHRLRVAVTSSNYPRFSLNLNNDLLVWEGGAPVNATNTIVLGADSYVSLPTVALAELPRKSVFGMWTEQ
jgi:predicted acyl esterase